MAEPMASLKPMKLTVQRVVEPCPLECAVLYKSQLAKVTLSTTIVTPVALTLNSFFSLFPDLAFLRCL